jgi:hypothetical protein
VSRGGTVSDKAVKALTLELSWSIPAVSARSGIYA